MTHEISIKTHDDHDKKKKWIAFKSSIKKDESSNEDDDEKFAMMVRRFKKFFRKEGQRFNKRCDEPLKKSFKKDSQKKEPIICYECKKSGHIRVDYSKLKSIARTKRKAKRQW